MPKKKAAVHAAIRPWLSARYDCKEGRFIQIGNSLLLSEDFQKLTPSAQMLYLCLAMESGGKERVTLSRSHVKKYGISEATYSRAIKQLISSGFIVLCEDIGRLESNSFRFSTAWKSKSLYQNDTR